MCAHRDVDASVPASPVTRALIWLGAGELGDRGRDDEQSAHVIAGVVVLVVAALAWLVSALALTESTTWPVAAIVAVTCVAGVLVGAVSRAIATGPTTGAAGVIARGAVAVGLGVVVGELAALVLLSGPIDRLLDVRAARNAESTPAVAQARAEVEQTSAARAGLDVAVDQALRRREDALVVARCEYNPRPDCPQVLITGDPGAGPETRTANEFLADAQRELDTALADRNARAPELDAQIADDERALAQARRAAAAEADSGLGARWIAMNDEALANPAALVLRLFTIGLSVLLSMLPLILKLWRGETTRDRGVAAHVERERAELTADTSIEVKRAEVRAAVENLWAEQQLASARLAVEAQLEIDREQQRRRVIEAREPAVRTRSERIPDDVYLPIAAEAEAVSLAAAEPPAAQKEPAVGAAENLPAPVGKTVEPVKQSGHSLSSVIPEVTKTASRWIRPFVPPIVASAIDTTTRPLRGVRQVLEETEEIQFWLKRTRKVSVDYEETESPAESADSEPANDPNWVAASTRPTAERPRGGLTGLTRRATLTATERGRELVDRPGPHALPPGP